MLKSLTRRELRFDSPGSRAGLFAGFLWAVYVIAEHPWSRGGYSVLRPHLPELLPALFVNFGAHVASAFGLYPWDFGAVQFISGFAAVVLTVRLLFWAFKR